MKMSSIAGGPGTGDPRFIPDIPGTCEQIK